MRRFIHYSAFWACVSVGSAFGQETPPPYPEFTFKRVGVPQSGTTNRLNVQIDPEEQAAALAVPEKPAAEPEQDGEIALPAPTPWDWFWKEVSPKLEDTGPLNIHKAIKAITEREGLPQPRLQHLQDIARVHGTDILSVTVGTPVSPALVVALISVESAGNGQALSEAGAQGLMQLIPATAERFGVEDSTDPTQNIRGGVAYLEWLIKHFQGDPIFALAGYNAGENAVGNHGGIPPFAETRAYVPKVLAAWHVARGLCLTPPELLTDGCVFTVMGTPSNG
ncbi:lytic transglycosylase domain-containing protein [Aliiroseovarius sp. F20344]|uniref:lytic transglycosylase domain-containing protein n=1 Tax=Aliiroseovarius sp. F20344 TaxID=2926414 RepID=UPI001FF498C9|nr:lytic transglycosylase domain-containing protein [Aliiroseovarius sp. F20344]MCK0142387.1 lytic transglycosylase domain-containing protein [Aliiroseovarius sp. F20344]